MSTVKVEKMCVVALYVSDLEKSKAFYADRLGFEFSETMGPGILMKGGGNTFYIEGGYTKREKVSAKEANACPCFGVEGGLREAFEKLQKADVTIVSKFQEFTPTFAFFRIADPDGNVFELAGKP